MNSFACAVCLFPAVMSVVFLMYTGCYSYLLLDFCVILQVVFGIRDDCHKYSSADKLVILQNSSSSMHAAAMSADEF